MTIIAVIAVFFFAVIFIEPFCVCLKKSEVKGPASLAGLKFAFVSDLHCQGKPSLSRAAKAVKRLGAQKPDILILGGDYADATHFASKALELCAAVEVPLGIYAVRGNHDYNYDLESSLSGLPIKLLDDEGVSVNYKGGVLHVAGLTDYQEGSPNGEAALKNSGKADFTVLVSHNPRAVKSAVSGNRVDLALCGHTHGGQVTLFGLYSPLADRPMPAFRSQWQDVVGVPTLYSNGLGTTLLPIRFMAHPQIHIIEIV